MGLLIVVVGGESEREEGGRRERRAALLGCNALGRARCNGGGCGIGGGARSVVGERPVRLACALTCVGV